MSQPVWAGAFFAAAGAAGGVAEVRADDPPTASDAAEVACGGGTVEADGNADDGKEMED